MRLRVVLVFPALAEDFIDLVQGQKYSPPFAEDRKGGEREALIRFLSDPGRDWKKYLDENHLVYEFDPF
jgi:hypothetical protein